jgi:hypothetical protein
VGELIELEQYECVSVCKKRFTLVVNDDLKICPQCGDVLYCIGKYSVMRKIKKRFG